MFCDYLLEQVTIREVARLLGMFASCFLAVPCGRLHYRKTERLKEHYGKFDKKVAIPVDACVDIEWWRDNIMNSFAPIHRANPNFEMTSDASSLGWGAFDNGIATGGQFTEEEQEEHINVLELKAALFALQSLCPGTKDIHILLKVDNTSAVSSINKMCVNPPTFSVPPWCRTHTHYIFASIFFKVGRFYGIGSHLNSWITGNCYFN